MAPWHFERLIDPLLFMVRHTRDTHLKASCVSALADLVLACKGRGFHNVLNEVSLPLNSKRFFVMNCPNGYCFFLWLELNKLKFLVAVYDPRLFKWWSWTNTSSCVHDFAAVANSIL